MAALGAFSINVPTVFSGNGYLAVYLSEPFALGLAAALLVAAVIHKYRPTVWGRRMLTVLVAFFIWFAVISIARSVFGGNVKQSLLILRTTLLPLAAFFAVDAGWDNRRTLVRGMVLFNAAVVLFHLPEWSNLRMSAYLGNSIVFTTLVAVLVPLNVYVLSHRWDEVPVLKFVASFNILAALVLPIWCGSRSGAGTVALALAASVLVLWPSRKTVLRLVALALVAAVIHAAVWLYNPSGAAYGIYRLLPTPGQVAQATGWHFLDAFNSQDRDDHAAVAAAELVKSDEGRAELVRLAFDEFRRHPIFGSGQVYFEIDSYRGRVPYSAHNFVLDHLNAYGSLGFLLYLSMFGVMLAPKLRRWRPSQPGFHDNAISLITTAVLFGVSLTQPTMMIAVIVTSYVVVIAALQKRAQDADGSVDEVPIGLTGFQSLDGIIARRRRS